MKKLTGSRQQRGFTLVELSIVLVVVGLLFAAVVKGQEVVDSAKAQKLINDIKSTEALIQKFVQIKSRMPGDCNADGLIDFPADQVTRFDVDNSARANLYDYTTSQKTFAANGTDIDGDVHRGCAQQNGGAYTSADAAGTNNWLNDMKLAGLVSDSVPNRTFAKQVNEDFLFVGNVTDNSGSSAQAAKYNAIIIQNVPQWMARQVATAINGTDANSNRGRVRQLVRDGSNGSYVPLWSTVEGDADVMRDAMVSVVYFFDRIPATNTN